MKDRNLMRLLTVTFLLAMLLATGTFTAQRAPNFIIIFADDLGYADVGSFGASGYQTPHLDRMAREGVRLTNFYSAQAVCSASRAALLTGCYPNRVGITGALFPNAPKGLNAAEITIAEVLKGRGYATGAIGKWHLGDKPQFLPARQGFDEYLGLPYSNDMWPGNRNFKDGTFPPLPLIDGVKVIAEDPDQSQLTTRYTERAVRFIEQNKARPFFLYVAHSMPHVPLFVSTKFKGKTERGLYGDVIAEIDWSVGEILNALKRAGVDDNTLVVFTSDNGPWLEYGAHGGSAGPLRGSKGTSFDGGVRVPFIARWPGKIQRGSVWNQPAMTIDMLPTLAGLAQADVPADRIIDGRDLWPLLSGKLKSGEVHDALYFYWGYELHAVRSGKWKLHVPHAAKEITEPGSDGLAGKSRPIQVGLSLYDLEKDIGEKNDVQSENREVVDRLMKLVERAREDLGDSLTKRDGKNLRPAGE
jgi:arylsulfatase A